MSHKNPKIRFPKGYEPPPSPQNRLSRFLIGLFVWFAVISCLSVFAFFSLEIVAAIPFFSGVACIVVTVPIIIGLVSLASAAPPIKFVDVEIDEFELIITQGEKGIPRVFPRHKVDRIEVATDLDMPDHTPTTWGEWGANKMIYLKIYHKKQKDPVLIELPCGENNTYENRTLLQKHLSHFLFLK